jgi:pimeloyl-ACP methyl ester carboxylesterase
MKTARLRGHSPPLPPREAHTTSPARAPTEAPRPGWAPKPTSRPTTASRPTSTVPLPPDRAGPFSIDEVRTTLTRNGRTIRVTAEVPRGLQHTPTVLFLPGFKLDSASYQGTTKHLASHGFTVVRVDPDDDIGDWDHREMTNDALAALNWATAADGPLAKKVDANAIGIAGHSLGGKLATMAALKDPRIKAVFAIDPVNQRDPDLFTPGAESIDRLAVPFGLVGQTVDTRGGLLRPAATPEGRNFQAFFDRATSSPGRWAVTLPGADHFDFTDDRTSLEGFASNGGTARREDVVQATRTLATTFFRDALKKETLGVRSYVPPGAGWQQR